MNNFRNAQLRHDNATPPEVSDAEERFIEDYTARAWNDGAALAEMAACSSVWGDKDVQDALTRRDYEYVGMQIVDSLKVEIFSDAMEAYDADRIAREDALGDIREDER